MDRYDITITVGETYLRPTGGWVRYKDAEKYIAEWADENASLKARIAEMEAEKAELDKQEPHWHVDEYGHEDVEIPLCYGKAKPLPPAVPDGWISAEGVGSYEGWCWLHLGGGRVVESYRDAHGYYRHGIWSRACWQIEKIRHVMKRETPAAPKEVE